MKRRAFIAGLAGAAAMPLIARGQERVRRVGVLFNLIETDAEAKSRLALLRQELQQSGWVDGQNIRIDVRYAGANPDRYRKYAADLVALAPDVIVAATTPSVAAVQQATRSIPIVFTTVVDPVGGGFVTSLAKPGGNTTGFTLFEFGIGTKWLELLKEIHPRVKRALVLRATTAAGAGQFGALQALASSLQVNLTPAGINDPDEISRAMTAFAREPDGGLIMTAGGAVNRETVLRLAAQHRLPAIYPFQYYAVLGGLMSYGPSSSEPYRRAADYVSRILKGEKPADLPVQAPTKYELVLNLKTAKALGLTVPPTLLARADEVIE